MNRELLTLYGLKWNPFATDVPVESLLTTPAVDSFCRRVEHHLVSQGGFALVAGEPAPERASRCACSPAASRGPTASTSRSSPIRRPASATSTARWPTCSASP